MAEYVPRYYRVTHIDLWLPLNFKIEFFLIFQSTHEGQRFIMKNNSLDQVHSQEVDVCTWPFLWNSFLLRHFSHLNPCWHILLLSQSTLTIQQDNLLTMNCTSGYTLTSYHKVVYSFPVKCWFCWISQLNARCYLQISELLLYLKKKDLIIVVGEGMAACIIMLSNNT